MLSPAAKGSEQARFRQERQPVGCEARHDLVFARARETERDGATARRYSANRILEPFRASISRGRPHDLCRAPVHPATTRNLPAPLRKPR
jgi:hypothetical protein